MPARRRTPTHAPARPAPAEPALIPRPAWTAETILALGTTTDLVTAGRILGLSRNTAYRLARRGAFPVPVIHAGARYRVPTAALVTALAVAPHPGAPHPIAASGRLATRGGTDEPPGPSS